MQLGTRCSSQILLSSIIGQASRKYLSRRRKKYKTKGGYEKQNCETTLSNHEGSRQPFSASLPTEIM